MANHLTKSLIAAGTLVPAVLPAPALGSEFTFESPVTIETGYGTEESEVTSAKLDWSPEVSRNIGDTGKFNSIFRLRYQDKEAQQFDRTFTDTYSNLSKPLELSDSTTLELREFTYETAVYDHYLIAGKQQIVWGKSDGLKVLDIVNPQSFSEFILEPFEESRIPLCMLNLEMTIGSGNVQFIWVPDTTVHHLPRPTADYGFSSHRIVTIAPAGTNVTFNNIEAPELKLSNSDYGVRWSDFIKGWDVSALYLNHIDDTPVFYREIGANGVTINPEFERTELLGASASTAMGDFTLRTELAYTHGKYRIAESLNDIDGVSQDNELATVAGLDWFGLSDTLISGQVFFEKRFVEETVNVPALNRTFTLLLRRNFLNDTLVTETLFIHNQNDEDGLVRPKVTFDWSDSLKVWFGADIFYGSSGDIGKRGIYEQYDKNDRLILGLEWTG